MSRNAQAEQPGLADADLPALFKAANRASLSGQHRFMWFLGIGLVLNVLAALAGLFLTESGTDLAAACAAMAFFLAILAGIFVLIDRPERAWYEGRAAAESAKTLAWLYAVGGGPFSLLQEGRADVLLAERFQEILREIKDVALSLDEGEQLTPAMQQLRGADLAARRAAYGADRLENQRAWYAAKASHNEKLVRNWRLTILALQAAGLTGAILKATGSVDINLLGLLAAAAAGAAAWLQAKEHATLANAYGIAAQELGVIRMRLAKPSDEADWAAFVEDAEEAISREHTLWLARRGARSRP